MIRAHNTRYRLERWETPEGQTLTGQLPESLRGRHFGPTLVSYILYQHHHCQVTQPWLVEQLREWGIDISTGQIDALLTANQAVFQEEKDALLPVGLTCSRHLTVDDMGARHPGKNGYTTPIGNEYFAWFASTESKSRLNFLHLLRAGHTDYWVEEGNKAELLLVLERPAIPLHTNGSEQALRDPVKGSVIDVDIKINNLLIIKCFMRSISTSEALPPR